MAFLSVLLVLMIEQARAVPVNNVVFRAVRHSVELAENLFHAGQDKQYGSMAWFMVVGLWTFSCALLWLALREFALPLAGLFSLALLYLTISFRQFSLVFTNMQLALNQNDVQRATEIFVVWRRQTAADFELNSPVTSQRLVRMAIEYALVCAYRQVFAVLFWFAVLPGPVGVVLYRVSELVVRFWERKSNRLGTDFSWAAQQMLYWMDYVPCRLAALSYAAAGNFEEATLLWRAERNLNKDVTETHLISAGMGALGLRGTQPLGKAALSGEADYSSQRLAAATKLIWRSLALWMGLLFLLTVLDPFR
jgi:cobalamin biosynthesis protein CobD/CbiB